MSDAEIYFRLGQMHPYDRDDKGKFEPGDWSIAAARGAIKNLCDRRDIKRSFEGIDAEVRRELVLRIAEIISLAAPLQNALEMTGCKDEEDLIDMARVGQSLMSAIESVQRCEGPFKNWSPADDPAEIVGDLFNALEEAAPLELEELPAKLLTGPHGSFHINYNDGHAVQYQTAAEYFAGFPEQDLGWISPEEREKAISSNSVWTLQWYPKNPISHYVVRGSTAAAVLAAALKEMEQ